MSRRQSANRKNSIRPANRNDERRGKFRKNQVREQDHKQKTKSVKLSNQQAKAQTLALLKEYQKGPREIPGPKDKLDPWQQIVKNRLDQNYHVIVDAPTTAGKTRSVEIYFSENIGRRDFRACYTCPVKSLANDKMRELRLLFGKENVGLSTGEIKENLQAPIVVATLESYRNTLIGVEPDLGRNLVVFDEYHYIQDQSRGSAWEESIILTPQHCQILLLSASVANPEDFKEWLQNIKTNPVDLVRVKDRPVPLTNLVFTEQGWISDQVESFRSAQYNAAAGESRMRQSLDIDRLGKALEEAIELELTPSIVYCAKRLSCEELAKAVGEHLPYLDPEEQDILKEKIDRLNEQMEGQLSLTGDLAPLVLKHGIAYHHSGMAPATRFLIECLLKEGAIRICFATMGLSLGINFAVRSTLISDFTRPSESGLIPYPSSEVLQMLGRAGRRGHDKVGFSLWLSPLHYQLMSQAKREPAYSRLRNDPTTYLGLIGKGMTPDEIMDFYSQSLRKFQQRKIDLSLITLGRLQRKLKDENLPCHSPAYEFAKQQHHGGISACTRCHQKRDCHPFLRSKMQGELTQLQLHLARVGATDAQDHLTKFGQMARFFPQSGGMLIAKYLASGAIHQNNLAEGMQLCAALAIASHKKPGFAPSYVFPWDEEKTLHDLKNLYPVDIFPELYERQRFRPGMLFREWNPTAGFLAKELFRGTTWEKLVEIGTTENFGEGDLMNLLLRVATYLRSIMACSDESVRHDAQYLEDSFSTIPNFLT